MKLRIDPTKIRFRLTAMEAEKLLKEQIISETLYLPLDKKLDYKIELSDHINLNYDDSTLILTVPAEQLKNLMKNPDKKGISSSYQEKNTNILFSFEIDMACDLNC